MEAENKPKPKPKKLNEYSYLVEKEGNMNVPLKIFANEKLMEKIENDRCIQQGMNVATLPGIKGFSLMMPDAHQGYGFSIGGVAAFDAEDGVISPGGIGFDINCGVRLLTTNLKQDDVRPKIKELLNEMFAQVPPGVGAKSNVRLSMEQMDEVLSVGAQWCVKNGYGIQEDVEHCESNGKLDGADANLISQKAKSRGKGQLGTLGAGNHFLEVQFVDEIVDKDTAKAFGITEVDQVVIMIH